MRTWGPNLTQSSCSGSWAGHGGGVKVVGGGAGCVSIHMARTSPVNKLHYNFPVQ